MRRSLLCLATALCFFCCQNCATAQSIIQTDSDSQDTVNTLYPKRVRLVAIGHGAAFAGSLTGLAILWYADHPKSSFHFFNDNAEWAQMDKAGHVYSAYLESRTSSEMWRWTGVSRKTRIILAATSGIAYQSIIEVLDGFSSEYGFSVGDVTANILGTATFVSQELLWDQQKLKLKFSTSPKKYADPELEQRADKIFGKSFIERALKDYNRQTYWLSADIKSLTHSERWPAWLNISLGYGAEGIWGGTKNFAQDKDGNIIFDRTDIPRRRQWLISPDLNFSAIKTNKKGLRILFFVLDSFKFPAPALELTGGKLKAHLIYF